MLRVLHQLVREQTQVLFFHIGSDQLGGGSKMLLRLLQSLDREQFDPVLLSQTNDELCCRARENQINVKIVQFRGALDTYNRQLLSSSHLIPSVVLRILQFNKDVWSVIRASDIIWCKNLRAVLTLYPYLVTTQKPSIWNIGLGLESEGQVKYLNSLALRVVDHIFIESNIQAERMFTENQYSRYREKFTIFHKGIDVTEFDPTRFNSQSDREEYRVGTAASLTPRKGIKYLIDAFPAILREYSNAELLIAGEPPEGNKRYATQLKQRVQMHGIEKQVEFLGWVDNMPKYLSKIDIFVLPSLNEGIPGVVREALAMRTPVVATDVGGTSEAVIDDKTGFLINDEDTEQISEKVLQLLDDESKRIALGRQGRRHVIDEFSIDSYVQKYENFLKSAEN